MAEDRSDGKGSSKLTANDMLMGTRRTPPPRLYVRDMRLTPSGTSTAMRLTPEGAKYFRDFQTRQSADDQRIQNARPAPTVQKGSTHGSRQSSNRLTPAAKAEFKRKSIQGYFKAHRGKLPGQSVSPDQQAKDHDLDR